MKFFTTEKDVESAVLSGKTVYWKNTGYKVVDSGLNDGTFLIGWNIGGRDENYSPLSWESNKAKHFFTMD